MTYLVLRFSSIGNVAMTVPVVASLACQHPNDTFVYVSQKKLAAMFAGAPNVQYVEADFQGNHAGLAGMRKLYKQITNQWNIDCVIDLQHSRKTILFASFFRLKRKPIYVRRDAQRSKLRMVKHEGDAHPIIGESSYYAEVFAQAGLKWSGSFQQLPTNPQLLDKIQTLYGDKQGKWIGIAPFAKYKSNMLPYRITKEVIAYFAAQPDVRVFLFGAGRVESEMLRQWATIYKDVTCVAGNLQLDEEFELMRHLDVMVCMDSANQHLASLVGLRAITIWGATHPQMGYAAWGQQSVDMLQKPIECRPCTINGTNECKRGDCACLKHDAKHIIHEVERALN